MECSEMKMPENEKKVFEHLQEHYRSKGNVNFYVDSNQLHKALPEINSRVIGKVFSQRLAPKGYIKKWGRGRVPKWQTCFNGDRLNGD